jgi:hypothetical protein
MATREIITDDQIIVILDTSPARKLAHEDLPDWVETYVEMSKDGYSFSLADLTGAELIMQFRSGKIPRDGYDEMLKHLRRFLNPNMPIMPGKVDLELMIGIPHMDYNILETKHLSQQGWHLLNNPELADYSIGPSFEEIREDERSEWIAFLERLSEVSFCMGLDISKMKPEDTAEFLASLAEEKLDSGTNLEPPMSVRMHLEIRHRFRQMARTRQKKKAYNPLNNSKKNDGLDVALYKYFILPAFVIAEDSGFFNSLEGINSFQRSWFLKPQELADQWKSALKPKPSWPVT